MNLEMVLGFLVVVLTATGMIYHLIKKSHADSPPFLRKSADIERLKAAIELSVEDGSRVHVTLGSADLDRRSALQQVVARNARALPGRRTGQGRDRRFGLAVHDF